MLKKIILLTVWLLLSYVVSLVVTMPAAFIWQNLDGNARLRGTPVSVTAVSGTIWQGEALVRVQGLTNIVHWQTGWPDVLGATLPVRIDVEGDAGKANATADLGVATQTVRLQRANIHTEQLNTVLRSQRIKLAGELNINKLTLTLKDQKLSSASGQASWQGGTISYPAGPEIHTRQMPAFFGRIHQEADGIKLGIRDDTANFDVIDGLLSADGIATLQVRKRLLDVSGEYWPRKGNEQEVVFKVKRRLW